VISAQQAKTWSALPVTVACLYDALQPVLSIGVVEFVSNARDASQYRQDMNETLT